MNLHHAGDQPDWTSLNVAQQNGWQRLAGSTHGILTPGNFISLTGFGLVFAGLWNALLGRLDLALILLIIGRLADLADGWAAHTTRTKSPLGEKIDAVFDKLGTFATVAVLASLNILPGWLAAFILVPQIIITQRSLQAAGQNHRLHPSRLGKLSMAAAWVCLPAFLAGAVTGSPLQLYLTSAGFCLGAVSGLLGIAALTGYTTAGRAPKSAAPSDPNASPNNSPLNEQETK